MINDFLATLDNIATAPDGVIWPSFTARTPSSIEAGIRAAVIGLNLTREQHFSRCLQLADLVVESPLASYITMHDRRITYSRAALSSRFLTSGVAVLYTGARVTPPSVNLALTPETPDIGAWVLDALSSTSLAIRDDRGISTTVSVSFSGGISSPIVLPDHAGIIQLVGTDLSALDVWNVSYRAPGASWVVEALDRVRTIEAKSIMSADLLAWYVKSPLSLDRLAVIVAALGTTRGA